MVCDTQSQHVFIQCSLSYSRNGILRSSAEANSAHVLSFAQDVAIPWAPVEHLTPYMVRQTPPKDGSMLCTQVVTQLFF